MKGRFPVIFLLSLVLVSCQAEKEENISGRYIGTQKFGIGQIGSPIAIVITQHGNTVTGSVTPPFSADLIPFTNGEFNGNTIRFYRKEGNITFSYEATYHPGELTLQGPGIDGGFDPLGCINPSSGEPCLTDSNGSFTTRQQK